MNFTSAFLSTLKKSKKLGQSVLLQNTDNADTIIYDALDPEVLELYVAREGDEALDFIFEQEKKRILRSMYGGK